jgi:predicted dehydrogenase
MMTVVGTMGQAVWDDDQRSLTVTMTDTSSGMLEYERLAPIQEKGRAPLLLELEHFLGCVEQQLPPKVTLEDSLRISQLIHDAERLGNAAVMQPNH